MRCTNTSTGNHNSENKSTSFDVETATSSEQVIAIQFTTSNATLRSLSEDGPITDLYLKNDDGFFQFQKEYNITIEVAENA